jgi:hypothetical protein
MDRADEISGKMEELHKKLHNVYSQIPLHSQKSSSKAECSNPFKKQELPDPEKLKPGFEFISLFVYDYRYHLIRD